MSKNIRIIYTIRFMIILSTLVNVAIVTAALIFNPSLFWLLVISFPLLIVGIYHFEQTLRLLDLADITPAVELKDRKDKWFSSPANADMVLKNDLNVVIGNDQCGMIYNTCFFKFRTALKNIPGKTYAQETGSTNLDRTENPLRGSFRTYSLGGEDLILQLRASFTYDQNGRSNYNSKVFSEYACQANVKLIELELPGPLKFLYNTISNLDFEDNSHFFRNKTTNQDLFQVKYRDAQGIIHFIDHLREISGRKPTGIRLSIIDTNDLHEICFAMRKTQIIPDFIVVEGSYQNTTTLDQQNSAHSIMPLYEALLFVSQTLKAYGLEKDVKIIASGNMKSCYDILKVLALGASAIHTDPATYSFYHRKFFSYNKANYLKEFHVSMMKAVTQAMVACGCMEVKEITLSKLFRKLDVLHSNAVENSDFPFLYPGTIKKIYNSELLYDDPRQTGSFL